MAADKKTESKASDEHRQKKRSAGRLQNPKVGDEDSIREKILHSFDKFEVQAVNDLDKILAMRREMALGTGKFKGVGIKDQYKAQDFVIATAEQALERICEETVPEVGKVVEDEVTEDKPKQVVSLINY